MPSVRRLTATDTDLNAYAALRLEMLLDSPWAFGSSPEDDRTRDPNFLREALVKPDNAIFAAIDDAPGEGGSPRILSTAGVVREGKLKRRHIAMIWGVYTTPAARGRGLSRATIAAAIEAAGAWPGITSMYLSVSEQSPGARRVYESLGFRAWGTEPDALRIGEKTYAEVHMHRGV